jgi:hypothetical protein
MSNELSACLRKAVWLETKILPTNQLDFSRRLAADLGGKKRSPGNPGLPERCCLIGLLQPEAEIEIHAADQQENQACHQLVTRVPTLLDLFSGTAFVD